MYAALTLLVLSSPPQAPTPPQAPPLMRSAGFQWVTAPVAKSVAVPKKAGGEPCCSPACTCGCNAGQPCTCPKFSTPVTAPAFVPVQQYAPVIQYRPAYSAPAVIPSFAPSFQSFAAPARASSSC